MKVHNLHWLHAISLLVPLSSLVPLNRPAPLPLATTLPPVDMFQLPWDQGLAWVAIDGLDNGTKRPLSSSHNYTVGGAVDFAPHNNMRKGENTSNYWVTAAAAGTVSEKSFCHVKINHGNGWVSEYQFLANVQVKVGDAVFRNQRLGIIANGVSQPFCPGSQEINIPHLHFTLRPTLRNVTFAGWAVNYLAILNRTTFSKNGQTVGLFQPLLNTMATAQIVLRGPITWDTTYIGSVDTYLYERWSLTLTEPHKFTLTATPTSAGLVPLILLLDANGNELARGTSPLISSQPAGNYFVQIQPQAGNGFYSLLLQKSDDPIPTGPYVSTVVTPASMNVGEVAAATVSLNNVPVEGFTSAEFTCTYDASRLAVSNISVASLFGSDSVSAVNDSQNGSFIVAIAGSKGNKATTDGTVFTFSLTGLNAGQSALECKARVSQGDNLLTELPFVGANLVILGSTSTPTPTPGVPPSTPVESPIPTFTSTPEPGGSTPTPTFTPSPAPMTPSISSTPSGATPTSITSNWLLFTNATYGFQFKYPPESQILAGNTANYARINLPFTPGTNLGEKYLQVDVVENANPCRSPVAASSIVQSSETVTLNGITFLKETGQEPAAGNLYQFVAYSTSRDNVCVSLSFVLHSVNPDNSATPIPVFDYAAESAVFGQIVSTYEWLTSPTATPTSSTPVETATPTPFGATPAVTATPTSITSNWLLFTNTKYNFQFKYPPEGQILDGRTDNYVRLNLPFVPGTNLSEKYLEVIAAENANPCQSPLATESILETSETVIINGISFLKQTGGDGTAGHINKWTAYSTSRDNACVSLDFVLRAVNPGVFTTPPPLYNEAAESAVFGQIITTYEWLSTTTPTASTPVETTTPTSSTPVETATSTSLTPVESPTPTALPDGSLTGQVLAGKPITVSLYIGTMLVTSVTANNDGTFSLTAPVGSYTVLATSSGFLSAQGSAIITGGSPSSKPTVTLLAGDIDGNNVIDQFDALTIGMNYNAATPGAADLNNDGLINVLDLELLADNYRATGPLAWE